MDVTRNNNRCKQFSLSLPPGFIELPRESAPTIERLLQLSQEISAVFGQSPPAEMDQGQAATVAMLAAAGAAAGSGGSLYSAAGIFRSPDEPRPIMALVNCASVNSAPHAVDETISGILDASRDSAHQEEVSLTAGRAVLRETSQVTTVDVDGSPVEIVGHAATAWIPHRDGGVAVISVSSNNVDDWGHVAGLARDIFEAFEWSDGDGPDDG